MVGNRKKEDCKIQQEETMFFLFQLAFSVSKAKPSRACWQLLATCCYYHNEESKCELISTVELNLYLSVERMG